MIRLLERKLEEAEAKEAGYEVQLEQEEEARRRREVERSWAEQEKEISFQWDDQAVDDENVAAMKLHTTVETLKPVQRAICDPNCDLASRAIEQ